MFLENSAQRIYSDILRTDLDLVLLLASPFCSPWKCWEVFCSSQRLPAALTAFLPAALTAFLQVFPRSVEGLLAMLERLGDHQGLRNIGKCCNLAALEGLGTWCWKQVPRDLGALADQAFLCSCSMFCSLEECLTQVTMPYPGNANLSKM